MKKGSTYAVCILIVLAILNIMGYPVIQDYYELKEIKYVEIKVTDKSSTGNGANKIYGKDETGNILVLENSDNIFNNEKDYREIYGSIEKGKEYRLKVGGHRNKILDSYPNILEVEEIKNNSSK